jgi:ABC-type ATPase involved in cell division
LISKPVYKDLKDFFEAIIDSSIQKIKSFSVPSVLFLYGPSGSGKNSTVDFLCSKYDIEKIIPKDIDIEENDEDFFSDLNYPKDLMKVFQYALFWHNPRYSNFLKNDQK